MARPYPTNTLQPSGHLEFKEVQAKLYRAFLTPPKQALPSSVSKPEEYKRPIFDLNYSSRLLTIYPFRVWGFPPMSAKYFTLNKISFDLGDQINFDLQNPEDILEFLFQILPSAFIEDYNYGLGFKKNYKPIVSVLEDLEIEELHILNQGSTMIDLSKKRASITRSDLNKLIHNIDIITQRTQKVSLALKKETTSNLFTELFANITSQSGDKISNTELARRIGTSAKFKVGGATKKEQHDAIEVITMNSKKIIQEQPTEFIKLRNDIELVSLEQLIEKFDTMLSKKLSESAWQKLFDDNPFILNMAFGIPIIKLQEQASVGGIKLSGSGNKITDFLVKNSITGNAAIIEIKTPDIKLLSSKEYRASVFPPSSDISGAINQVLDQIFLFQREINSLKAASREYTLESYSVMGILIAGISPTIQEEQKSFELFRGNSKNIQLITFDELLRKLKELHAFLTSNDSHTSVLAGSVDLPF